MRDIPQGRKNARSFIFFLRSQALSLITGRYETQRHRRHRQRQQQKTKKIDPLSTPIFIDVRSLVFVLLLSRLSLALSRVGIVADDSIMHPYYCTATGQ